MRPFRHAGSSTLVLMLCAGGFGACSSTSGAPIDAAATDAPASDTSVSDTAGFDYPMVDGPVSPASMTLTSSALTEGAVGFTILIVLLFNAVK